MKPQLNIDETEISGFFDIDLFNKKNSFTYIIKDNSLNFLSADKTFSGQLNFKPFYFSSDLNFNYISQKKIFQNDTLILIYLTLNY